MMVEWWNSGTDMVEHRNGESGTGTMMVEKWNSHGGIVEQ